MSSTSCPDGYSRQTIQGVTSCFRQGPPPAKDDMSSQPAPSIYVEDNWAFCGKYDSSGNATGGWQSGPVSSGGCQDLWVRKDPTKTYTCTSDGKPGSMAPLMWCPSTSVGALGYTGPCKDRVANFTNDTDEQPWCDATTQVVKL